MSNEECRIMNVEWCMRKWNEECGRMMWNFFEDGIEYCMMEKKDIETREELENFLWAFYEKAFRDELIGRFFTEVVPLDLDTHIPVIADFWESVVFGSRGYRKNVMQVHQHIHQISPIHKAHLDRWVKLFTNTVDENFEGSNASLMKQRAASIATLMDIKLNHNSINKSL